MLNITDLKKEQRLIPILRLGFRPFFLLGGIFAFIAMAAWLLMLNGAISTIPLNGSIWWHSHEMLFGFVPAIIAGFLLTAVQTWSGVAGVKGNELLYLVLTWISARVLIIANLSMPVEIIMLLDLSFLPLTGFLLARPLIKIKQYKNMIFLPVIALMTIANFFTYLPQLGFSSDFNNQGMHSMVILSTFLVALMGARVIPMFTANGTKTQKVLPIKWLEVSALFTLFTIFVFIIAGLTEYKIILGAICLVSSTLFFYRNLTWRPLKTLRVPLVWTLHVSMMFLPIGLLLMGLHFVFGIVSFSAALHSLTVGVIGGMILAMTSRVSLGHTGRPLAVPFVMVLAFIAIACATLVRSVFVAVLPQFTAQLWLLSGILWCIAFGFFVWVYLPILCKPRADGRPG